TGIADFVFRLFNLHVSIVLHVFPVIINGGVDKYPPEPAFEGIFFSILSKLIEHLHKTVIHNLASLLPGVGIPQGNAHSIAIEMPVKLFQRFWIPVLCFPYKVLFQLNGFKIGSSIYKTLGTSKTLQPFSKNML